MIEHYNHFLPKLMNVTAVTFGKHVFYAIDSKQITKRLRTHEEAHVEQYRKLGFFKFLFLYIKEYLSYRMKGYDHNHAYYEISFEKDAHEKEKLNS